MKIELDTEALAARTPAAPPPADGGSPADPAPLAGQAPGNPPPLPPAGRAPSPTGPVPRPARPRTFDWRYCTRHPGTLSRSFCLGCGQAYCQACSKLSGTGYACPVCHHLCESTEKRQAAERLTALRARSLWSELGTVSSYPFRHALDAVLLALVAAVLSLAMYIGPMLSVAIFLTYGLSALTRVSEGDLDTCLPSFDDPVGTLVHALVLGLAVQVVTLGPFLLIILGRITGAVPALAYEPRTFLTAVVLSLAWALITLPAACMVAGLTHRASAILNPAHALKVVGALGGLYVQTLVLFLLVGLVGALASALFLALDIFVLSKLAAGVVQAFTLLAQACLLGLALRKRAPEFELE